MSCLRKSLAGILAIAAMLGPVHLSGATPEISPEVMAPLSILKNPGFEDGSPTPAEWGRFPNQNQTGACFLADEEMPHSGKASGLLWSTAERQPGSPPIQWSQYKIPVEGGSSLLISFWVKTDGDRRPWAGVHFYGAGRTHLGFTRIAVKTLSDGWVYVQDQLQVPDMAETMGFVAYGNDRCRTWYDDIYVMATPSLIAQHCTPKIDGSPTDSCWTEDKAITSFAEETGRKMQSVEGKAWVSCDDEHLYVAFRCPIQEGNALKHKIMTHDGEVWLDDSVEVFLDPKHHHCDEYQLIVNSLGVVRDAKNSDTKWDSEVITAISEEASHWFIEMAIPFKSLDIDLDVSMDWGINLAWNDAARKVTNTWSLHGFHDPSRYGNLTISADLSEYYSPSLRLRAKELDSERRSLLKDLRSAEISPRSSQSLSDSLEAASEGIRDLRSMGRSQFALPEREWGMIRDMVGEAEEALVVARSAAVNELYQTGREGSTFRVVIAHSLQKIPRTGPVPFATMTKEVRLQCAKDESESFQLIVCPGQEDLENVRVELDGLTGPKGHIPISWRLVEYVETAEPGYPTKYVGWWPDPLLEASEFDIEASQRQPIWFTVSTSPSTTAGTYRGIITIIAEEDTIEVPVMLEVRNFALPRPGTLATPFGLYASTLSRWYFGESPYKEEMPMSMFHDWCRFMANYRLTPKNIAREYTEIIDYDEGRRPDLKNLGDTVKPLASDYFSPNSFCIYRLPSNHSIEGSSWDKSLEETSQFLKNHGEEWEAMGLPGDVYIYGVDEPKREQYPLLQRIYKQIKETVPNYPIMQTIGDPYPEELVDLVDIWCPLTSRMTPYFYNNRALDGDTLWTYVCCSPKPPYANFFIDQSAVTHRVLFWQTKGAGATGLLYWCICWWDGLPRLDSGEPCFPVVPVRMEDLSTYNSSKVNGDGLLCYPGVDRRPIPSLRLEVIRDGIEDFEYLALLDRLIKKVEETPSSKRLKKELLVDAKDLQAIPKDLSSSWTEYTDDPEILIERRREVGDMIEKLVDVIEDEGL